MFVFDNGLLLAIDRILHPHARLAVYRLGQVEVTVDRAGGDLASIRACLATPMYRALLASIDLPKTITVLDVGANVGGFPLLLLNYGYTLQQLVAVEFNPNTSLRLQINLTSNFHQGSTRTKVLTAGVWFEEGNLRGVFGWGNTGDRLELTDARESSHTMDIPLRTLNDIIETEFGDATIDLCKIDIEGSEYDVFGHPSYSRLSQVKFLIIEIHNRPGRNHHDVTDALEGLGFSLQNAGPGAPDRVYLFRNTMHRNLEVYS